MSDNNNRVYVDLGQQFENGRWFREPSIEVWGPVVQAGAEHLQQFTRDVVQWIRGSCDGLGELPEHLNAALSSTSPRHRHFDPPGSVAKVSLTEALLEAPTA